MKTRIMTNAEIKKIIGSGSANDTLIDIWNDAATELLCEILGVENIASHTVTDERVKVLSGFELMLADFPVDTGETITLRNTFDHSEVTGFSFRKDPHNRFTLRVYDAGGTIPLSLGYDELFVSYTAGYSVLDTVEVISNTGLADKTITVTINGTATTWTFKASGATGNQINVGGTVALTAANILAALGGTLDTATVTLPLGSSIALGSATSAMLTITNAEVPKLFKNAVALIAAGGLSEKEKGGDIVSYSIGGKSVTFRNDEEGMAVQHIVSKWLPTFKRVKIAGI